MPIVMAETCRHEFDLLCLCFVAVCFGRNAKSCCMLAAFRFSRDVAATYCGTLAVYIYIYIYKLIFCLTVILKIAFGKVTNKKQFNFAHF